MWRRRLVALAVIVIGAHGSAAAQVWPSKPIRAIVPFGAGSATDIVPRIVFDPLSAQLGQPIIVENRVGAGSSLGTAAVAKADPDGHTLLATSSAHTITPAVYASLTYDAAADFAAVTPFGSVANVLVISPAQGLQDHSGDDRRRQGQARLVQLCVGRRRLGHPSERRAAAPECRVRGGARAVPGRSRGAHRGDGGARGILFLPDQHGAAVHPGGQAARRSW